MKIEPKRKVGNKPESDLAEQTRQIEQSQHNLGLVQHPISQQEEYPENVTHRPDVTRKLDNEPSYLFRSTFEKYLKDNGSESEDDK